MRIAVRITMGYGIIIFLLAVSTIYQLSTNRRLVSAVESLAGFSHLEVTTHLQLMSDRDRIEQSLQRFLANGSAEDSAQLKEATEDFGRVLEQIKAGTHAEREQSEIDRLVQFWHSFSNAAAQILPAHGGKSQVPDALRDSLDQLGTQTQTLYQISRDAAASDAAKARELAAKSGDVILSMGALVVFASVLSAFLVIRSISLPLTSLLQGARAITDGKSFYRLDTSRKDELSQLAKIINDLGQQASGRADYGDNPPPN